MFLFAPRQCATRKRSRKAIPTYTGKVQQGSGSMFPRSRRAHDHAEHEALTRCDFEAQTPERPPLSKRKSCMAIF